MGNIVIIPPANDWYTQSLKRQGITVTDQLDSGTFFIVTQGRTSSGQEVVVKTYQYFHPLLPLCADSVSYFDSLEAHAPDTDGVVNYTLRAVSQNTVFLVRPKFERSLLEFAVYQQPRLQLAEKQWIFYQLVTTVIRLHAVGLAHGDIKPSNVFVSRNLEVSLTDNWGTAAYMAPEIAAAEKFSFPVDVFAFACTWYEIITGKLALLGGNLLQLNRSAIEGTRNEIPAVWNPKLVSLLRRCWAPNQRERPTFNEIVSAFERQKFALVSGVDQSEVQSYVNRILRMEGRAGQDN
jgi:serine/threonine protein kinase